VPLTTGAVEPEKYAPETGNSERKKKERKRRIYSALKGVGNFDEHLPARSLETILDRQLPIVAVPDEPTAS
jgi:hypothetical protein